MAVDPTTDLRAAVADLMPGLRADLERLVRIPSIAFPGFPEEPVTEAARATAEILTAAGLPNVELLEVPGGPPAVFGELAGPPGAPTVLLYAHYDVQPAGDESAWTSPAFEPTERDGRLYGRGTADDKCGIVLHAGALRALATDPPVTIKVVVEGEEETGRGTFGRFVAENPERLAADVIVVADAGNWQVGEPTLTTSLRGLAVLEVEVETLRAPVHSGLFGGPIPDALIALSRMLASLHDDAGNVAVEGLISSDWTGRPVDETDLRTAAGVLDGVELIGDGSVAERLYMRPSITAIGVDAPAVQGAGNALVPRARARISARIAPAQDPVAAQKAIAEHLRRATPWGARARFEFFEAAAGADLAAPGGRADEIAAAAMAEAYGKEAVRVGSGGAIPLVVELSKLMPDAELVLWGAADDAAQIHAADESVDLSDLERATLTQAVFLRKLGAS
jgi:acetylornithine deacetylase/succinyl-diaminopimelate desuccinylase-like protein